MRRITMGGVVLTLWLLAALPALAQVQTMYARFTTPVRSGMALSSTTVGTLQQGQAVQVNGRDGNYFKVSLNGRLGYVYYNKLDDKKPEDVATLLATAPGGQGLQLTEMEAGGALRGLSPMAEDYTASAKIPQWAKDAVEQMQARQVTLQEMDAFQRAGHLGEYGEGGGR